MKKNMKLSFLENKKMNDQTYALRRKVIDCLYELKAQVNFPRIDVRITDRDTNGRILGMARMNCEAIWISEEAIALGEQELFSVVAHEVLHAAFGVEHDESCPLMGSYFKKLPKHETINLFKKWTEGV